MNDQLKAAWPWLSLAILLVALVEWVPASNRFLQWTLWLVVIYLFLENGPKVAHLVDSLVAGLRPV